jgi:MFS family permease
MFPPSAPPRAFRARAGSLTESYLIAGAVAIGLFFTFALPARTVTVRMLVPEDEVKAAMAMDSVSYNLGRSLAPVLSVAVIIIIGFGWRSRSTRSRSSSSRSRWSDCPVVPPSRRGSARPS